MLRGQPSPSGKCYLVMFAKIVLRNLEDLEDLASLEKYAKTLVRGVRRFGTFSPSISSRKSSSGMSVFRS